MTARIDNGTLTIKGDNLDNGITVAAGANAGDVVVTGVNAGSGATNVNGIANGAITLSGFNGGIKVKMKGGNDSVAISDLTAAGRAMLKGGQGNDSFRLEDVKFGKSLRMRLGSGDDMVSLTNVEVSGKTRVQGGRGDDAVAINESTFSRLYVALNRGDDSLEVSDTTVTEKTRLKGGKGSKTFADGGGNSLANLKQKLFVEGSTTNQPLTLAINGASSANEGGLYTLGLSASGTGATTISQWVINWGDGMASQVVSGNPSSVPHTFMDGPNSRTISATATSSVGTFPAGNTVVVTVNNVPPTLSISGAAIATVGTLYTLNLSSSDPGADTITQWTISWGDSTENQIVIGNPTSVTHTFTTASIRTISATATDEDGTFPAGNTVNVSVNIP